MGIKKCRFTEEQFIGLCRQAKVSIPINKLCCQGQFSDVTFYKWRTKHAGIQTTDVKRLRELESENAKLKRLLAAGSSGHPCAQGGIGRKALAAQVRRAAVAKLIECPNAMRAA